LWHEIDLRAKINVFADHQQAGEIYQKQPSKADWIVLDMMDPWLVAPVLLYFTVNNKFLLTKGIPA
jgi:tRNA A58 N-methylase Trm61